MKKEKSFLSLCHFLFAMLSPLYSSVMGIIAFISFGHLLLWGLAQVYLLLHTHEWLLHTSWGTPLLEWLKNFLHHVALLRSKGLLGHSFLLLGVFLTFPALLHTHFKKYHYPYITWGICFLIYMDIFILSFKYQTGFNTIAPQKLGVMVSSEAFVLLSFFFAGLFLYLFYHPCFLLRQRDVIKQKAILSPPSYRKPYKRQYASLHGFLKLVLSLAAFLFWIILFFYFVFYLSIPSQIISFVHLSYIIPFLYYYTIKPINYVSLYKDIKIAFSSICLFISIHPTLRVSEALNACTLTPTHKNQSRFWVTALFVAMMGMIIEYFYFQHPLLQGSIMVGSMKLYLIMVITWILSCMRIVKLGEFFKTKESSDYLCFGGVVLSFCTTHVLLHIKLMFVILDKLYLTPLSLHTVAHHGIEALLAFPVIAAVSHWLKTPEASVLADFLAYAGIVCVLWYRDMCYLEAKGSERCLLEAQQKGA